MVLSRADVIRHLQELGYYDISDDLLDVFVQDLNQYVHNETVQSSTASVNDSGSTDVSNTSTTRRRITKHSNGRVSVQERECNRENTENLSYLANTDMSDSLSTLSLSTLSEDRPFPRRVWNEDERLPSCIIPRPSTAKKTDPLKMLKKYEQTWNHHAVPGQKRHTALRSAIRRQMAECDLQPFVAPQRDVYVNRYEVPTDKKRERLRWAVRNKMMG